MSFLTYMLTRVFNFTFPSINLSMFSKEHGTSINNEDKKEFYVRKKMLKFNEFCNF